MKHSALDDSPLGKKYVYTGCYEPGLLFPVDRALNRKLIGITDLLPFQGEDIWNAYEVSWLNPKGKPLVAHGEFSFACNTPRLIESKSFKLYLNSFNNTRFSSLQEVETTIIQDLSASVGAKVGVNLTPYEQSMPETANSLPGINLDLLDISCDNYLPNPDLLKTSHEDVTEVLHSNLLKSNCPITDQPDWASIGIEYSGKKIIHENLLAFIVSFRNHNEFHEHCVEEIFTHLLHRCQPEKLLVYARYTRRGGLDINPYRANYPTILKNVRLLRQ